MSVSASRPATPSRLNPAPKEAAFNTSGNDKGDNDDNTDDNTNAAAKQVPLFACAGPT